MDGGGAGFGLGHGRNVRHHDSIGTPIEHPRDEIGVRRAMGATSGNINTQFVGAMWVIATFGILIGLIFAIQFPIMNVFDVASGVYLMAILVSVAIIYLLVTICAYYPSRQAAKIRPAMALRED